MSLDMPVPLLALIGVLVLALSILSIWQYGQALKRQSHQQDVADRQQQMARDILKISQELQTRSSDLLDRQETLLTRVELLVQRFETADTTKQVL